jgi:hypothetical protein
LLQLFRYAIVFDDGTFETHDILSTEEKAREIFSQRWMEIHSGGGYLKAPIRMDLIRVDDNEEDFLASYDVEVSNAKG